MNLKETAKALRESAEYLESIQAALIVPDFSGTDIRAALQQLRLAFPGKTKSIQAPRMIDYGHSSEVKLMDQWSIYIHGIRPSEDVTDFRGNTLAEAVNAALRFLTPPPADPVADVQAALTPAPF